MRSHSQTLEAVKTFIDRWKGRGYEKGESQQFWTDLLHDVLGVETPSEIISFENQVKLANTSFIDAYIAPTKVLIEQKGLNIDLRKAIKQSDGSLLSPFQQAKRYAAEMEYSRRPRWVVTCNFKSFLVYDMEKPHDEPEEILLEDLEKDYYRLRFLVEDGKAHLQRELEISIKAGELVGKLYDAFLAQYGDDVSPDDLHSLNVLCVRLVFCLYAEDAGIFSKDQFYYYVAQYKPSQMRVALRELFTVLDTKIEDRDRFLDKSLKEFPYVNGSLFHQNPGEDIPQFDEAMSELLLKEASLGFDWSEISPTIFGAVFESTLNPETRRSGGMHYTSIENIHKVIDPLFLNDLNAEFEQIKEEKQNNKRNQKLDDFQNKIASLTFLDPACGSGNFLTETYLSLRKLENEVIKFRHKEQRFLGFEDFNPIKVSIHQFYGIEINDFAVTVATTAMWIAESQMMHKTERIIKIDLDYLPLKSFTNIRFGNALRMDWNGLLPGEAAVSAAENDIAGETPASPAHFDYIMGNPPFVGYSLQSKEQKDDILSIYVDENGKPYKTAGKIDYVSGWYFKAAQMMQGTNTQTAFVSTNSITQGEQVAAVWKPLYDRFGIHINFAYRTFRWDSEASLKAHVHCVIVGFNAGEVGVSHAKQYTIYDNERAINVDRINPYLVNADNIWIESRQIPISAVPILQNGGKPTEGGFLILTREEKIDLLKSDPLAESFIRPYMMGKDFIDRKPRYCLWMVGINPAIINKCPNVKKRIENVKDYRLASPKIATQKKAETPMLFDEVRECTTDYVAIPKVSSENRRYIPMEYLSHEIIPGDSLFMLQNASLYHFGVLTSNVHMAWMRAVCGRLKSDYRYSKDIVYNNFPWPDVVIPGDAGVSPAEDSARAGRPVSQVTAGDAGVSPANQNTNTAWHSRGYLPHCESEKLQSITFRLCDSVPKDVIIKWKEECKHASKIDNTAKEVQMRKLIEQYEDAGLGECYLKDDRIAELVQNALLHFDGERYILLRWCIMPNHVHVLVKLDDSYSLSDVMHSWRSYTSHEANKILNRTGQFWMEEYFDRYIRDEKHLNNVIEYIDNNPVKAGLVENPEDFKWCSARAGRPLPQVTAGAACVSPANDSARARRPLPQVTARDAGVSPADDSARARRPLPQVTAGDAGVSPADDSARAGRPLPQENTSHYERITRTAQAILDARALYPDSSLADLYDDTFMPPELRKAHQNNDRAVMEAYGFDWRTMTESECVAELFKLYQKLVDAENAKTAAETAVSPGSKAKRTRKKKTED